MATATPQEKPFNDTNQSVARPVPPPLQESPWLATRCPCPEPSYILTMQWILSSQCTCPEPALSNLYENNRYANDNAKLRHSHSRNALIGRISDSSFSWFRRRRFTDQSQPEGFWAPLSRSKFRFVHKCASGKWCGYARLGMDQDNANKIAPTPFHCDSLASSHPVLHMLASIWRGVVFLVKI
jgi:hypothetical protein